MPELPEVEVTRRSFAQSIAGGVVRSVTLGKPLRWPLGLDPQGLVGRVVKSVGRRGKYLLLELDEGFLLIHLGMSGSLRFASALPPMEKHDHFEMVTSLGVLRLHDPRRFGAVVYVTSMSHPVAKKLLDGLGMEPLSDDFVWSIFRQGLRKSRAQIKPLLLNGRLVVGVGNIYASEVLFLSGIHPAATADSIGDVAARRLYDAIRTVLARAVERGGSTLKDFASADGQTGHFQLEACVYGRAGLACTRCNRAILSMQQGQRSTYFCPHCQKG
jgi:formamidopyrimidine-DNA glycosylase